ncbi:MAG: AAA family ATPase [Lachnospiraceae bacterium]|nr:AAA family ATPase [Lachnospiraceae bacterium]
MALFSKVRTNADENTSRRLKNILSDARDLCEQKDPKFVEYLSDIRQGDAEPVIRPMGFFLDVVEMIMSNRLDFKPDTYHVLIKFAERIYKEIFIYDEETPDAEDLELVFLEFFEERGVIAENMYHADLFRSFYDKNNYIFLINSINQYSNAQEIFLPVASYGVEVREFFIDDGEYLAHLIRITNELAAGAPGQYPNLIEQELKNIRRMNGVYNVDAVDIAKAEKQLLETRQIMDHSIEVINQADQSSRQLVALMEDITTSLHEIGRRETEMMQKNAESYKKDLVTEYKKTLQQQKKQISLESSEFVKQMFQEATKELEQLRAMAGTIASTTAMEITRMNQEAEKVLRRVERMVNDDAEVRRIMKQATENQDFMKRVSQLEMLNDTNLAAIEQVVSQQKQIAVKTSGEMPTVIVQQTTAANIDPALNIPQTVDTSIPPINPLLDPAVPFKKRLAYVMAEKKKRMKKGEHYHKVFDDVLVALMEDANPYLIGPSGCGKTYMIKQLTELLNMEFIDIGYINEEYDILGYQTATGGYSAPNFYMCYKYGKVAFCDELDNGNSRATVKLNSFLTNVTDASYNFPNSENVKRHPNFRIIAAGNTAGNGADMNYNTREKIEESVQQRFMPIFVDYDNEVEKAILKDYPAWFSFIELFRTATTAWGESSGMGAASGILTTRDATNIRRYLDNESFDMQKIIKYQFIQTKDLDYLLFLEFFMKEHMVEYPEAEAIVIEFMNQVDKIREDGRNR